MTTPEDVAWQAVAEQLAQTPVSFEANGHGGVNGSGEDLLAEAASKGIVPPGLNRQDVLRAIAGDFGRELAKTYRQRNAGLAWEEDDLTAMFDGGIEIPVPDLMRRNDGLALFYRGMDNLLFGARGSGKSWITLSVVVTEVRRGNHVYFIGYELSRQAFLFRLVALGLNRDELSRVHHYYRPSRPPDDVVVAEGTSLVVVDTMTAALAAFEYQPNDVDGVENLYRTLIEPFTNTGAGSLIVDHPGHGSPDRPSNSSRKLGRVQGAAYQVENIVPLAKGGMGYSFLILRKDNQGGLDVVEGENAGRFVLRSDDSGTKVDCWVDTDFDPTVGAPAKDDRKSRVLLAVSRYAPMKVNTLAREAAGDEVTGSIKTYVRLINAMLLEQPPVIALHEGNVVKL